MHVALRRSHCCKKKMTFRACTRSNRRHSESLRVRDRSAVRVRPRVLCVTFSPLRISQFTFGSGLHYESDCGKVACARFVDSGNSRSFALPFQSAAGYRSFKRELRLSNFLKISLHRPSNFPNETLRQRGKEANI